MNDTAHKYRPNEWNAIKNAMKSRKLIEKNCAKQVAEGKERKERKEWQTHNEINFMQQERCPSNTYAFKS